LTFFRKEDTDFEVLKEKQRTENTSEKWTASSAFKRSQYLWLQTCESFLMGNFLNRTCKNMAERSNSRMKKRQSWLNFSLN